MTRINLVNPAELTDQHLFAEWREIKMVPAALHRAMRTKSKESIMLSIPKKFLLGKGHVKFFYDKGQYLAARYRQLSKELKRRGFRLDPEARFDRLQVYRTAWARKNMNSSYTPTKEAYAIIRARIQAKLAKRPNWYRYYGSPCDLHFIRRHLRK